LKYGIGSSFSLIYVSNFIFPITLASQTLGFVNTTARLFTIPSAVIAESDPPYPMAFALALCSVAAVMSLNLEIDDEDKE